MIVSSYEIRPGDRLGRSEKADLVCPTVVHAFGVSVGPRNVTPFHAAMAARRRKRDRLMRFAHRCAGNTDPMLGKPRLRSNGEFAPADHSAVLQAAICAADYLPTPAGSGSVNASRADENSKIRCTIEWPRSKANPQYRCPGASLHVLVPAQAGPGRRLRGDKSTFQAKVVFRHCPVSFPPMSPILPCRRRSPHG